jgi:acyl-CoA synthetase (AMP-forming)/AMP-acid ligase II
MKAADIPLHYNAASILEHNVIHRPKKVGLYSQDSEFTFSQLNDESNQVANALRKLGLRSGETVALLSTDSKEWVTAFFGVLKSGAVAAGLNTLLTTKDYEYILNDCGARIAFIHETILPQIQAIQTPFKNLKHIVVIGNNEPEAACYESFIEND